MSNTVQEEPEQYDQQQLTTTTMHVCIYVCKQQQRCMYVGRDVRLLLR